MVNYFLETYPTDKVVIETGAEVMIIPQLLGKTLLKYRELLWANGLCHDRVDDE